jgi:hypothetical protein
MKKKAVSNGDSFPILLPGIVFYRLKKPFRNVWNRFKTSWERIKTGPYDIPLLLSELLLEHKNHEKIFQMYYALNF